MSIADFNCEYVENKFKEWKEKYDVPDYYDFELRAMFALEKQFMVTPDEHVKKKYDLMKMISDIKRNMGISWLKNCTKNKGNILIIINHEDSTIVDLFQNIIGSNLKKKEKRYSLNILDYYFKFYCKNCTITFMTKKAVQTKRGFKFDNYLNLTGDIKFENEYLKSMIK